MSKIEKIVEDHWATVRLDPALRDAVEEGLRAELAIRRQEAEAEHKHLSSEKASLTAKRQKLVEAIYSGAVPMDLIAGEQERITTQLTSIEERLTATSAEFDAIEANLAAALDLACDCHAAYLAAGAHIRRLFNQAFFTHLYIDEEGIHSHYAPPFDTLLDHEVLDAGHAIRSTPNLATSRWPTSCDDPTTTNRPPGRSAPLGVGLSLSPFAPVQGVEGSNTSTLVHLRDSLSNPTEALQRLIAAVARANFQVRAADASEAVIAQAGAEGPGMVKMEVKENRKLSPGEIEDLVARYLAGASIRSLGLAFGLHEQTARAHLRRQGVRLRPIRALTEAQEIEVVRLYVEEVWTLAELAEKFGVSAGAIRKVLVRRGVARRPRARRQKRY